MDSIENHRCFSEQRRRTAKALGTNRNTITDAEPSLTGRCAEPTAFYSSKVEDDPSLCGPLLQEC
jgi:hypothetical protein